MDCLFCKIIAKEIPAEIISENDNYLSFLDITPRAEGHTLVVPKKHANNIIDLDPEAIGPLFEGVRKTTTLIKNSLNPDGFTIGINHGSVAGQAVDHLHVHIIPRHANDGDGSIHSVVRPSDDFSGDNLSKVAEKIRGLAK